MKKTSLWAISVTTSEEAGEAVSELLQRVVSQPTASYTDVETGEATIAAYLLVPPDARSLRSRILAGLADIRNCGLPVGRDRVSIRKLAPRDWAESWKRHFKPIEIGSALLIKPSWSKRRSKKGQAELILDPGLSFGTGQHPTTSFCLEQLVAFRKPGRSFLDIGTGSGILAIAAKKLGYTPVEAFDFDPDAVRIARVNFQRNCGITRIPIFQADLTRLPKRSSRKYDLICANLISTLLVAERDRILTRLKPAGSLIVAGILEKEFAIVERAYCSAGLRLLASRSEREWRSGVFSLLT